MVHDIRIAGVSVSRKLELAREALASIGARAAVFTALDEIMWLFNVRGGDIPFNPVAMSYAIVSDRDARLFISPRQVDDPARRHLQDSGVSIHGYDDIFAHVDALAGSGVKVSIDPATCSLAIYERLNPRNVIEGRSVVSLPKAIKNDSEIAGMRLAHVRDGAALTSFLSWLHDKVSVRGESLTEVEAADVLESFRKQQPHFVSLSFDTISGVNANGAIIHYKPEAGTCATIAPESMYLLDSGAQYLDGTTDVTRTLYLGRGEPTPHMKRCYTRVVQGHIALATAVFPVGTVGSKLDPLARMPLWGCVPPPKAARARC